MIIYMIITNIMMKEQIQVDTKYGLKITYVSWNINQAHDTTD